MNAKTPNDKNSQKIENRKAVLDAFRKNAVMTVSEAAEASRLSKPTVHRATEFLKKAKLLLPAGKGASTDEGGKKPALLTFNADYGHILCFQIRAGDLLSAVSDLRGRLIADTSVAFKENTRLDAIMKHMKTARDSMTRTLHLDPNSFVGIVVGCHGVTDSRHGTISSAAYFPSWGENIPFEKRLRTIFDTTLPIFIDNSNRYDAIAEMHAGLARGADSFMIIDGETDGLGAALVLNGTLWHGSQFLAGEIGHMVVDPTGSRTCLCGGKGCLETMVNMTSLVAAAKKGHLTHKSSQLFARMSPGEISYRDIYDIANAGDAFAREIVSDQARWLAIGIINVSMVADPGLIILQGPYSKGGKYLVDRIRHFLNEFGMPRMKKKIEVTLSSFGRERGLVGGAHFVANTYFENHSVYSA